MKHQKRSVILGAVSGILLFAAAILQMIATLTAYDPQANYFLAETILPTVSVILAITGALIGITASFLVGKELNRSVPFSDDLYPALPAVIATLVAALLLLTFGKGLFASISSLLLLGTALYAALSESKFRTAAPATVALLGFLPVLASAALTAYYYFDTSIEMNAPFKVLLQTALLFSMLYFTGELRFLLNRSQPRLYLSLSVCALASSLCCAFALVPAILGGISDRIDYLAGALAVFGIAITLIFRILHLLIPTKTDGAPLPDTDEKAPTVQEEERPE